MVTRRKASFEEAMDIELERIRETMDRGKQLAAELDPPANWPTERAHAYLIRMAVQTVADCLAESDLEGAAAGLVHLAAASRAFFDTFVEGVEVEEDDTWDEPGTNAKGSKESN